MLSNYLICDLFFLCFCMLRQNIILKLRVFVLANHILEKMYLLFFVFSYWYCSAVYMCVSVCMFYIYILTYTHVFLNRNLLPFTEIHNFFFGTNNHYFFFLKTVILLVCFTQNTV